MLKKRLEVAKGLRVMCLCSDVFGVCAYGGLVNIVGVLSFLSR